MDGSKLDDRYKSEELGYSSEPFANHITPEKEKSEGMEHCKPIANSYCKQCLITVIQVCGRLLNLILLYYSIPHLLFHSLTYQ